MLRVNILEYYHRQAPMRDGYSALGMFSKQMSLIHRAMISINIVATRNASRKKALASHTSLNLLRIVTRE